MRPRSYLRVGRMGFILLLSHGLGCYLKFLLCGDFVAPALPFARSWVRPHTLIAWEAIFVEHRSVFIYFVNGFVSAGFITDSLFYFRVVRAQHVLVFPFLASVGFLCPFGALELVTLFLAAFSFFILFCPHSRHARKDWIPLIYMGLSCLTGSAISRFQLSLGSVALFSACAFLACARVFRFDVPA